MIGYRGSVFVLVVMIKTVIGTVEFTTPAAGKIYYQAPPNETVMVVRVRTDGDNSAHLFLSGGDRDWFNINANTGIVTTKLPIHKNVGEKYRTSVVASAGGTSTILSLVITVTVKNQFVPTFNQTYYHSILFRGEPLGGQVTVVKAHDRDVVTGNAQMSYSIPQGNYSEYFLVNKTSGNVTLAKRLPNIKREIAFVVRVTDSGSPRYWSDVTVSVYIRDVSAPGHFCTKLTNTTAALLCWHRSLHGVVTNYRLDYWPISNPYNRSHVLLTDNNSNETCHVLTGLVPWTMYNARVHAHNFEEFSPSSALLAFRTSVLACNLSALMCNGNGRCMTTYMEPGYICSCNNGFYGKDCESFNPCSNSTCENNGVCRNISSGVSLCDCTTGFYGSKCQLVNPCLANNPCVNGDCRNTSHNNFRCECNGGHFGYLCERFNPCVVPVCLNGGACQNLSSTSYNCHCVNGFYGPDCGRFDPCSNHACLNSGTCKNLSQTIYTCSCGYGFFGIYCELFDPCILDPKPCLHNGLCSRKSNNDVTCSCSPGYYGLRCDFVDVCVIEHPCLNGGTCRNISSGNYVCECAPGWSGQNCTWYDPCSEDPCLNGGSCFNTGNNASRCICSGGYYGSTCKWYNPCATRPCRNGGTCSNRTQTDYDCSCTSGFWGHDCERLDPCISAPCGPHGTCKNVSDTNHLCICEAGYIGSRCDDYNPCIVDQPCLNNGRCEYTRSHEYVCHCTHGHFGPRCENYNPCVEITCGNGGTCYNTSNTDYRCGCRDGHFGRHCERYNPCVEHPCENAGHCTNVSNAEYRCNCPPGFFGKTCYRYDPCISNACQNLATCVNVTDSLYTCNCKHGYYGEYCENFNACVLNKCENNATCRNISNNSYVCDCLNGYSGDNCQVYNPCVEDPCNNRGTCNNPASHVHACLCVPGFHGETCDHFDHCFSQPCLNGAKCTNTSDTNYFCTCLDGFFGTHCQNYEFCSRISPCINSATCSLINVTTHLQQAEVRSHNINNNTVHLTNNYRCICLKGFTGGRCEVDTDECLSSPCVHGSCVNLIGRYTCSCNPGFTGVNCEHGINECSSSPCQHGGECIDVTSGYECVCPSGWEGTNCQFNINECRSSPCLNGGSCIDMLSAYRCVCPSGIYGANCERNIDNCINDPCLNGGQCQDLVEDYYCACSPGFGGRVCQINLNECSSNPCLHGTCVDHIDAYACSCAPGYKGVRCDEEINECTSQPCKNNGICHDLVNGFLCRCLPGFQGASCDIDIQECSSNPCVNSGTCIDLVNGFMCYCPFGYSGVRCENNIQECESNPCLNGATCVDHVNAYSCMCPQGYAGMRCETNVNDCESRPCSNGATCVDRINGFSCVCPGGYKGPTCGVDINECESTPCHHGATCVDGINGHRCLCRHGYIGENCEITEMCRNRTTLGLTGRFFWTSTFHSQTISASCPYGAKNNTVKGKAFATCSVLQNGGVDWTMIDTSRCKELGAMQAEAELEALNSLTSNPATMTPADVGEAADKLEQIIDYAIKHRPIARQVVNVLSSLLEVSEKVLRMSSEESNATERFVAVIDKYSGNAVVKDSTDIICMRSQNLVLKSFDVEAHKANHSVTFKPEMISTNGSHSNVMDDIQLTLPAEAVIEATSDEMGEQTKVRLQFISYTNSKFFVSGEVENANETGDINTRKVITASIKGHDIKNLTNPVTFRLPVSGSEVLPNCVYWDEDEREWSTAGMKTRYDNASQTALCQAYHLTNFAILLDADPTVTIPKEHKMALSFISYIGCALSILGLTLTLLSYAMFPVLHRDKAGKILINLCCSMLLMNTSFLLGAYEGSARHHGLCLVVAVFLHYFILTTLLWMGVEAVHMYHVLIRIFRSYEERFMVKRCAVAWGLPLAVVGITLAIDITNYRTKDDYCRLNYENPYVYYISFLGPSCLILVINSIIFVMLTRVILRPKLRTCKGKVGAEEPKVTAAQVRGAITVMVLLGVTWIFGALAIGEAKLIFSYIFCIANSLQGFLIFVFRCFMYPEARMAWIQLVKQRTFKRRRGVPRSQETSSKGYEVNKANSRSTDGVSASNTLVTHSNLWSKTNTNKSRFKSRGHNSQRNLLSGSLKGNRPDVNLEYVSLEKLRQNRSVMNNDRSSVSSDSRASEGNVVRPGELTRL